MFGIPAQTEHFQFSDEQREHMKSFGDSALIILDSKKFIDRVTEAAKAEGYTAHFGKVNYIDTSNDYANVFLSMQEGIWNVAFWKRIMYAYQKECRFIFSPGNADIDHLELQIGDISDISVIVPAESALTGLITLLIISRSKADKGFPRFPFFECIDGYLYICRVSHLITQKDFDIYSKTLKTIEGSGFGIIPSH